MDLITNPWTWVIGIVTSLVAGLILYFFFGRTKPSQYTNTFVIVGDQKGGATTVTNYNVNSYNQQGGITAGQVNIQPSDRVLTGPLRQNLDTLLATQKYTSVRVTAVMGDQEALRFAIQIKDYLDSKGISTKGVDQAMYSQPVRGQQVRPAGPDGIMEIIIGGR